MQNKQTNFDRYVQEKLKDPSFRARFEAADRAWDTALQLSTFQADLTALDQLDDNALWVIVRGQRSEVDMNQLADLLEKNSDQTLTADERLELVAEIDKADRFMLLKAHAAILLQSRGHIVPPFER